MRVLLVHPPAARPIFSSGPTYLPLGLAYVAGALSNAGHEVRVLDMTAGLSADSDFLTAAREWHPDWVGFTAVTPSVNSALRLCRLARAELGIPSVMGGPHVSALPEEALAKGADIVVRGEGEDAAVELCARWHEPWTVPGVFTLREGGVVRGPQRMLADDIDRLPLPKREIFPDLKTYTGQPILGNRTPVGTILTSRGCPYHCSFCYKAITDRSYRMRAVSPIVDEWRLLVERFKVAEIAVCDDAFTVDPGRVIALCERLIAEGLSVPWSCPNGIRAHPLSKEMEVAMRRAGCYRTAIGVESGDEEILRRIEKGLELEHLRRAFRLCREVGIKTTAFLMLGSPGETRRSMEKTIDFAVELDPDYAQFLIATPYPGTRLREDVLREGRLLVEDWDDYGSYENTVYFEMADLSESLVLQMRRSAYRRFYLRPAYICRQLLVPHTYRFLGRSLRGMWGFVVSPEKGKASPEGRGARTSDDPSGRR